MIAGGNRLSSVKANVTDSDRSRLLLLLGDALRPIQDRRNPRPIIGPGGEELYWSWPSRMYCALGPRPFPYLRYRWYMIAAVSCRSLRLDPDRLLVSRHIQPPGETNIVRLDLFDTKSLVPFGYKDWPRRPIGGDPVHAKGGLMGRVDLRLTAESGQVQIPFPAAFRDHSEIVVPATVQGTKLRTIQQLLIARPLQSEVEVVTLTWWDRLGRDRVMTRAARDRLTGNFVVDGIGVRPCVLNPDGEFAGFL